MSSKNKSEIWQKFSNLNYCATTGTFAIYRRARARPTRRRRWQCGRKVLTAFTMRSSTLMGGNKGRGAGMQSAAPFQIILQMTIFSFAHEYISLNRINVTGIADDHFMRIECLCHRPHWKFLLHWNLNQECTGLSKKMSARLRELATELGASSRNLADVFLDIPVHVL